MPLTLLRQAQDVRKSQSYVSNIAPSETAYQTDSDSLQYDLNAVRSALNNFLNRSVEAFPSAGHWWADISGTTFGSGTQPVADTGAPRGINKTSQDLYDVEQKRVLFYATLLADIEVPASQDYVVLGAGEIPNFNGGIAAIGNGKTTIGVVVAYNATFGAASLAEVTGETAVSPKNLCVVVDASTRDAISSAGRPIFALIQSESNVDGSTLGDATPNRVQLSFVRPNAEGTDLELCPAADIAGKTINFSYVARQAFDAMNEQNFLNGGFVDVAAGAITTTLQQVYDSSADPATIVTSGSKNIVFDVVSDAQFNVLGASPFSSPKGVAYLGTELFPLQSAGANVRSQFHVAIQRDFGQPDPEATQIAFYNTNEENPANINLQSYASSANPGTKASSILLQSLSMPGSASGAEVVIRSGSTDASQMGTIHIGDVFGSYDSDIWIGPGGAKTASVRINGGDGSYSGGGAGGVEINAAGVIKIGNDNVAQNIQIGTDGLRVIQTGAASVSNAFIQIDNSDNGSSAPVGTLQMRGKGADAVATTPGGSVTVFSGNELLLASNMLYNNTGQAGNNARSGAITMLDTWFYSSTLPAMSDSERLFLALSVAEYDTFGTLFAKGTNATGGQDWSIIGALNEVMSSVNSATLQQAYDQSSNPATILTEDGKNIVFDLTPSSDFIVQSNGNGPTNVKLKPHYQFEVDLTTGGGGEFNVLGSGSTMQLGYDGAYDGQTSKFISAKLRAQEKVSISAARSASEAAFASEQAWVEILTYNEVAGKKGKIDITATGGTEDASPGGHVVVAARGTDGLGAVYLRALSDYTSPGNPTPGLIDIGADWDANIKIGVSSAENSQTGSVQITGGDGSATGMNGVGVSINSTDTGVIKIGSASNSGAILIGDSGTHNVSMGAHQTLGIFDFMPNGVPNTFTMIGKWGDATNETPGGGISLTAGRTLELVSFLPYENTGQPNNTAQSGAITFRDNWTDKSTPFVQGGDGVMFLALKTAEWDEFANTYSPGTDAVGTTNYSIIGALNQTANHAPSRLYHTVTADAAAGTDTYGGVGGNLSAPYPDSFATMGILNTVVFLDGRLMQPGADAAAGMDYYPGSAFTAGNVRIKWNRDLLTDDVIATLVFELKYAA